MAMRRNHGFTLMEMVAALTVLGLLAAIAGPYLVNGVRAYNDNASAVHTLSKLRVASERLVREIREVRNVGVYDISTPVNAPNSTLQFFKSDTERVTLDSTGALLTLSYLTISADTPYTLSDELSSITFSYKQIDGTDATGLNDLAFIDFELVLTHAGNNYSQRSRVALRNQP